MQDIAYTLDDSLYLNITNRCTNACQFCIRYKTKKFHAQYNLWLDYEPTTEEILKVIGDPKKYKQIIFCGYGEPLLRLETVKEVARTIKSQLPTHPLNPPLLLREGETRREGVSLIRVDTNGLANLFYGRNILPELEGLVDIMSISLNAENAELYNSLCNPFFGPISYQAVVDFIREAKKHIPEVEASIVDLPIINIEKCKDISKDLGVKCRVRPYYEEKYVP